MLTSFGLWLVALLFCAALVWWIAPRIADPVRDLLLPMWLPASVLVVAGYALFFTDQGRDLGVGLLGSSHGKLLLLAFALLYWALGTWHMARIGLDQRWPDRAKWPRKYKFWLPSLPRLLGAFAHLFAALSLAFATRYAIDPAERLIGWTPLWGLAFVPPAIIVAGTLVLLLLHRKFAVSRARLAALEQSGLSCAQAKDAYRRRALRLRLTVWALIPLPLLISALLLLVGKLPRLQASCRRACRQLHSGSSARLRPSCSWCPTVVRSNANSSGSPSSARFARRSRLGPVPMRLRRC
jgi:hypothetical protein